MGQYGARSGCTARWAIWGSTAWWAIWGSTARGATWGSTARWAIWGSTAREAIMAALPGGQHGAAPCTSPETMSQLCQLSVKAPAPLDTDTFFWYKQGLLVQAGANYMLSFTCTCAARVTCSSPVLWRPKRAGTGLSCRLVRATWAGILCCTITRPRCLRKARTGSQSPPTNRPPTCAHT
eukprot:365111-Chlamydomonas_euryale.AAC.13